MYANTCLNGRGVDMFEITVRERAMKRIVGGARNSKRLSVGKGNGDGFLVMDSFVIFILKSVSKAINV